MKSAWTMITGDALKKLRELPDESAHVCVTSPPYWGLRDYGVDGQIGLEPTRSEYIQRLVTVFREVRRVLRCDGTCWVNIGDTYASDGCGGGVGEKSTINGSNPKRERSAQLKLRNRLDGLKPKDKSGIPWRVALALQDEGWWLRSDIVWAKSNPMPESVRDRPTVSHEFVFLLSKSERYFYNSDDARERCLGGEGFRNWRDVWHIPTQPSSLDHFAAFPEELARRCIVGGSRAGDTVLDPFSGTGTTGIVALKEGRRFIGVELNRDYVDMAEKRSRSVTPSLWLKEGSR